MKKTAPSIRAKEFHNVVANTYDDLKKFKKEGNKTAFNALVLGIMTQVNQYITVRMNIALAKGLIPERKYNPIGVKNQLFIDIYNHFDQVEIKEELYPWLFKKADELLAAILREEELDEALFKNIDNYSQAEWDSLELKFGFDADGDLVTMEEIDDISYRKDDYILTQVFVEDGKKETMVKLDKKMGREAIRKHTDVVLRHLPSPMSAVFELATEYQFDMNEIAGIRNQSLDEVQQLFEDTRKTLEASFLNRYLKDNS